MRRHWLARVAVAAAAISVPVTAFSGTAQAATASGQQTTVSKSAVTRTVLKRKARAAAVTWNMVAAARARRLVGDPYAYGGTSPAGFDCSGLTQWIYRHTGHGKVIDRTADDQYRQFKRISHKDARPGDLVFFHDTSDPASFVYHVGVYEGGEEMVAATTYGQGVQLQSFAWGGDTVTFGTITHA